MLPWAVRHIISPMLEKHFGRSTFAVLSELEKTQWLSPAELEKYRLEKLRKLVGVMLNKTQWYAEFAGVDKSWLPESLDDLAKLPRISKA